MRDRVVGFNSALPLLLSLGVATVCAAGCGSATLVHDGGTDAGGNGMGGHGGQGGTAGGGGKVGTGGSAGATAGTNGGGTSGAGGAGGKVGTGGSAGATAGSNGGAGAGGGGTAGAGAGGKAANGSPCSDSQLCQSGNCSEDGGTGICCPANYANCGGSCVNLQSDANNCGTCRMGCGSLGCSSGQCGCTAATPNGTICIRPGQTRGTCWTGACVLPQYFPGCNTAADCVPGGCTGPGGYCLGTIDVAGQVSCTDNDGEYIACPTSQGCGDSNGHVGCQTGSSGMTYCDGPSDCGANGDCCSDSICYARTQAGIVGSGCPSRGPGNQLGVFCDPLNPTTTCPAGKSCTASFSGAQVSFGCQ
jgi:hypothetical protein